MRAIGKMIRRMEMVKQIIIIGIMNYANGDRYNGEWKEDLKEGNGKMKFHL